jgi:hypothetical protein
MIELNRVEALDAAMNIVLNRGDRTDDSMFDAQRYMMMPSGKSVMVPIESLYNGALGQQNIENSRAARYAQGLRMHP